VQKILLWVQLEGSPEIDELDWTVWVCIREEKVFELEISMDNFLSMAIIQGNHNLFEDNLGFLFSQAAFVYDLVEEFPASADLRHQKNILLIFECLIKLNNVRMI
jgi:hypothetical protein